MDILLTRDAFREGVFKRDNQRCVLCPAAAQDAHHILERRLFSDGGYYLSNGASVCGVHHLACERTQVSVEEIRHACGIKHPALPDHLYSDQSYDKWGNPVMPNGQRLRGELFYDLSVQKALREGDALPLFTDRVKYCRTHHVPFSPGINSDDRVIDSMARFHGRRVICTIKYDGENTSLYSDGTHARSVNSAGHPTRDWVKAYHARLCGDIPSGWRVCGENLYAKHSIGYTRSLKSYFYGFSAWNETNECLSWDDTLLWFELLGIQPVEVLFDGIYDEAAIRNLHRPLRNGDECEGWVMRLADGFPYGLFRNSVAKYVRAHHVQTDAHWMHGRRIMKNELATGFSAF